MGEGDYFRRVSSSHRSYNQSEYTVFVDNLPNSCGIPWFSLIVERARYDGSFNGNRSHRAFSNPKDDREFRIEHKINQRFQSHVQAGASMIPNPGDLKERVNCVTLNIQPIASNWRIGQVWGDFILLDYESLKEESYEVGRMMIATENSNRIDDSINITVRGRNYSTVKVWEEECDNPFNERHIRDWLKVHIPALTENLKTKETEFGRDDDVEASVLLKDGSSRLLQVPRVAVINTENVVQECEESVVGESDVNNYQPTTIVEPQVEPAKIAEDQHKENHEPMPDPNLDPLVEHIIQNQEEQNGILKEARVKKRRQLSEILGVRGPLSHSEQSGSIDSGDIRHRTQVILKTFRDAVETSKKLGVIHHESDEVVVNRLVQLNIEEHKNRFQVLSRK
ncbi:hypothetical protein RHSIM_Rhsim03G0104400 [Rhododendron simsii]|uniref:DUF4283 domain-containing protein n=1 Tax=Rhododendron simsii TaxID=118357 RepID=A0A834HIG4_RHOSS|nr:hypothetical protein RHSIM_Rhsim03G0104400 [Rhododendron simsii]